MCCVCKSLASFCLSISFLSLKSNMMSSFSSCLSPPVNAKRDIERERYSEVRKSRGCGAGRGKYQVIFAFGGGCDHVSCF